MELKLGRNPSPPSKLATCLRIPDYLSPALPVAPASWDVTCGITQWPMYLNDSLGDCVAAGAGHLIEPWTNEVVGAPLILTDPAILKFYELISGYVPGDPSTDGGANMLDALGVWQKVGIGGQKILAYAQADPQNTGLMQTVAWLFSGVYIGVDLPASAMDQFQSGQSWSVLSDDGGILGGHCVDILGYDQDNALICTWGQIIEASWAWVAKYTTEAFAVIPSEDLLLKGKPLLNGVNLDKLKSDLAILQAEA